MFKLSKYSAFCFYSMFLFSCSKNRDMDMITFNNNVEAANIMYGQGAAEKIMSNPIFQLSNNICDTLSSPYYSLCWLISGEVDDFGYNLGRMFVNLTFGLFGIVDFASAIGMYKKQRNITQVINMYRNNSPKYYMLPGIGPTSATELFVHTPISLSMNPLFIVSVFKNAWYFIPFGLLGVMNAIYCGAETYYTATHIFQKGEAGYSRTMSYYKQYSGDTDKHKKNTEKNVKKIDNDADEVSSMINDE